MLAVEAMPVESKFSAAIATRFKFEILELRKDPANMSDNALVVFVLLRRVAYRAEKWGKIHRDIIVKFGRFPHRNPELGRETTPEEQAFLDGGGFGG